MSICENRRKPRRFLGHYRSAAFTPLQRLDSPSPLLISQAVEFRASKRRKRRAPFFSWKLGGLRRFSQITNLRQTHAVARDRSKSKMRTEMEVLQKFNLTANQKESIDYAVNRSLNNQLLLLGALLLCSVAVGL